MKMKKSLSLAFAALTLCAATAFSAVEENPARRFERNDLISRNYTILTNIMGNLEQNYVDSLPIQKMFDYAITGFLAPLDPYTDFFDEKEAEEFRKSSQGDYGGIGAFLMKRGDYIVINMPQEGSPANKAGLRSGDRILRVDSTDARGMDMEKLRGMVLGVPGTPLTLRVARPYVGADSVIDVTLTRQLLNQPTVTYSGVDSDGIGFIQLTSFGEHSADEVRGALNRMLADKNLRGIILDLTDNGGGLLTSAVEILEMFVPKGTNVLSTKGTRGNKEYITERKPLVPASMPVAVLIDGNSASAAEVTAGVLQDLDRAVLVGEKSYGKGLVQTTFPGPFGTMVKITTAKYYIPSGRLIQAYDYSHRGEDGSIRNLPDSLARPFLTKAGRTVYDGGGLRPDTVVRFPDALPVVYALAEKNSIFDYANKYFATHDTILSPLDFRVTDTVFDDFKKWLSASGFKYDTETQKLLRQLRDKAKEEGYLDTEAEARFAALEKDLTPDPESDLDAARSQIELLLAPEIIERYYHTRGHVINSLNYDPRYKTARAILLDPEKYRSMLTPPDKKKQAKDK